MTKPTASLSLDLDNLWAYQMTHGDPGWDAYDTYVPAFTPRALDLLGELDLTITFFLVGRDVEDERNQDHVAAIADAGHEIGNHSFDHKPWIHRWSYTEVDEDLGRTEAAIGDVAGRRPVGFRGPGYSLSGTLLQVLIARGYSYDASTLPTWIGPLARRYYFRQAKLDAAQRGERSELFGGFTEGRRPLDPYLWEVGSNLLLEIPVTTFPFARVPVHVSYLLTLAGIDARAATAYFAGVLATCRAAGVQPSILLHPLDLLGADDVADLAFFPAMGQAGADKRRLVRGFLTQLARSHDVVTMEEHARRLLASADPLPLRDGFASGPRSARRSAPDPGAMAAR